MKQKTKPKNKASKSGKLRTPITGHAHIGKELIPPMAKLGDKMQFSSWIDERLPEMIWAGLIRVHVDQRHFISICRRLFDFIAQHKEREKISDLTISGIAKLPPDIREELIYFILASPKASYALCSLKVFANLPARDSWLELLPDSPPDIDLLMMAVGSLLWHQSQEATDCRWVRVMGQLVSGKLVFPQGLHEMAEQWCGYPDVGDQRSVRPSIRAAEITPFSSDPPDLAWSNSFWDEAWINLHCFELAPISGNNPIAPVITQQKVSEIHSRLLAHWESSHSTTAVDAKHDAIFGSAIYALRILDELLGIGTGILGRLGVRTILEIYRTYALTGRCLLWSG